MLDRITPVILAYNEAPNIARNLDRLRWAREVVVVDSLSDDGTGELVAGFANARLVERPFDGLASQWTFAITETGVASPWILRLDSDYILTDALIEELGALDPDAAVDGYQIAFTYCIFGKPLRASLYPAKPVLFRAGKGQCRQDGHTEVWTVDGTVKPLAGRILHDDRKPLRSWLLSQHRYMAAERTKILEAPPGSLDLADRIRKRRYWAPFLVLVHCLVGKRLILDGMAGIYYSFLRAIAELILAALLMERRLDPGATETSETSGPDGNDRP